MKVIVKTMKMDGNHPRQTCRMRRGEGRSVRMGDTKVLRGTRENGIT